jgi:hypothetical protein
MTLGMSIFAPGTISRDSFETPIGGYLRHGDTTTTGTLHDDWVSYQCFVTALQVGVMARLASAHHVYNSTLRPQRMEVWAFSGYAGIGIYSPNSHGKLGDVRDVYGVDWAALSRAGLDVAMADYGTQNISVPRGALAASRNDSTTAVALVCGSKSSQAVFSKNYEECDGAFEFERAGSRTPFGDGFDFHVPS